MNEYGSQHHLVKILSRWPTVSGMVTVKGEFFLMRFDIRDYWLIWEDTLRDGDGYRDILVTPEETIFRLMILTSTLT